VPSVPSELTLAATLPAPRVSIQIGPPLVDLLFNQPAATDADLVFGAGFITPRDDVTVHASLPLPVVAIKFIPPARAELLTYLPALTVSTLLLRPSVPLNVGGASLPGVVFSGELRYYSRTQRPTVGQTEHLWQVTKQTEDGSTQGQQDAASTPAGWNTFWRRTLGVPQGIEHKLPPVLVAAPEQRGARHQDAVRLQDSTWFAHKDATRFEVARQGLFQNAGPSPDATRFRHQDGDRTKRAGRVSFWQIAKLLTQRQGSDFQSASPALKGWRGRYQEAVPPPAGISLWVIPEPPAPQPCYKPSPDLLFAALGATDGYLLFVCKNHTGPPLDGEPVVVPVRRVYFVINDVTLHRVLDGAPVPVFNLSLSLDAASWAWGFEAVLPAKAEALVAPNNALGHASGPVELVASINGTTFRVLAESISRERIFGDASIRISGRGRNAVLAAPYAPVMTFSNTEDRTAQQLMNDVLTVNGIPLGWTVDWVLTDWNVPAGVFAKQGTWIEALTAIAGAAGGYLIPHPSAQSIRVRHRYPVAPWEWNTVTPDFVLPVDAVARESMRWLEKPAYNRVFVSGQDVGVLGQVTRAGTAGDVLAPMVVDPLITEAAAARQRGIAVLADTGQQIEVSLRLPVLAETGIIEPGAFVEYQDGSITRLGLVRSTQVEAGMPEAWQTLGVQSYA
jgi:hypothetical protein